ncbi:MAG: hypothetical protein AAFY59_04820 [Pseudomonadota bacterium]
MNARKALIPFILLAFIGVLAWFAVDREGRFLRVSEVHAEVVPEGILISARIENSGAPDVLVSAENLEAREAKIIGVTEGYEAIVPGSGVALLASDGANLLLTGVTGPLVEGREFPLELQFKNNGLIRVKARLRQGLARYQARGHGTERMSVALDVAEAADGWKVSVLSEGFTFQVPVETPVHEEGFGHAHLYLNGVKLMRMYRPDAFVGRLPRGDHVFRVTLNTNTHMEYVVGGEPVAAEATVRAE